MSLVPRDEIQREFDEEEVERDELFIEKVIGDFRNEPSIEHDVYPESCDEEEKEEEREHVHIRRGDGRLYRNQTFLNGVAFKECVLDYALRTGRNVTQYRYDKDKIGFSCLGGVVEDPGDPGNVDEGLGNVGEGSSPLDGEGLGPLGEGSSGAVKPRTAAQRKHRAAKRTSCPFKVYATILPRNSMWKITVFVEEHTCIPSGDVDIFKVPVIARMFLDKIREEPEYYMPMKIEETVKERFGINVSRPQCQAARNKALQWIECEYDHQFARLRDYAAEIKHGDEESTVLVETIPNDAGQDLFNRFYVCFDVLRRTWKETCRPLIGVDGCFLKGKIKGQLLVALGRDSNNGIYPIAWSVVQVENIENWVWFVKQLKSDLDLKDGDGYIIVSDRQKGLIKAVELECPKIEHRKCVRHIYANLKSNHGSKKEMKPLIWNLAWSYNEAEYQQHLEKLFCYDTGVYEDVMKMKPRTWCRAFYKKGNFCEDVENNSTESFNSSIEKARRKPFVPMLEMIRRLAMARIAERSAISHTHKGICTPYVAKFLAKEKEKASLCKVTRSTNGMFEVMLSGCSYRVCLEKRTCTCMKWEICGIPCEHAYGVILKHKALVAEDYVCHWFRTAMWKRNYTEGLIPLRGARFWPSTEGANVHAPPEPPQTGRKRETKADKKRKKGKNESPTKLQPKEKKRIMHCGICGKADHNSRFHKKKNPTQASLFQGPEPPQSQAHSSQAHSQAQSTQSQSQVQSQAQSSQVQSQQVDMI